VFDERSLRLRDCEGLHVLVLGVEITLIKGKIEEIELPVKEVDIIVSEVSLNLTQTDILGLFLADHIVRLLHSSWDTY